MSMSSTPPVELAWEWADDRAASQRLLVAVQRIEDVGGGLLGVQQSPSLAGALPDPVTLEGRVVAGPADMKSRIVQLRLPRPELNGVAQGMRAGLGMVEGNVVICIVPAPADLADEDVAGWLAGFECRS